MASKLTPIAVNNIRPRSTSFEVKDASSPLRLAVQPSGKKSWIVRYRRPPPDRRTAKVTHDQFVSLAEARKWAAAALAELAAGRDPAALKFDAEAAAKKAAAERAADTVDHWVKIFLERYARKHTRPNTWRQAEHVFSNIVLPVWSGRSIHDIARKDVRALVEDVAEDRPIMANRALAHVSKLFNWLCERDAIAASPCAGVKPPAKERARDRVLTDDEIKRLWAACDVIGGRIGACAKLLLLTGQRLGEVCGMRRSEITGDTWVLPPERVKNKRRHDVPLSRQVFDLIENVPVIAGDEDFVFTSGASQRLGNMSHTKAAIDGFMKPDAPWVLHDLRRTAASGMAALGVRLPTIEKCLNHQSGTFKGVLAVYQRHDFAAEKRDALQRWADHVDAVVRGEPAGKVVKARFGRSA
jgi:integrase